LGQKELLVNKLNASLVPENVTVLVCLKSWLKWLTELYKQFTFFHSGLFVCYFILLLSHFSNLSYILVSELCLNKLKVS